MCPRYVPATRFELTLGSIEELTLYEFYKKVFRHYFCPTCGVQFFFKHMENKYGEVMVGVNARTIDDVDPEKLSVRPFDGKNLL